MNVYIYIFIFIYIKRTRNTFLAKKPKRRRLPLPPSQLCRIENAYIYIFRLVPDIHVTNITSPPDLRGGYVCQLWAWGGRLPTNG